MKQLTVHRLTTFPRSGTGGCPVAVVVEPEPLTDSARHALANQLGMLTAFIPLETPDPMPAVFFDKAGRQSEGEQALLGVFRALARTQRTIARRVRIDTDRGVVPVQEEVFRTPDLAQVWVEVPVPMLIPVTDPLLELHTGLQISGPTGAWRAGDTLLIHGASLAAVRGAQLDPHVLRTVLPEGLTGLLLFSMETTSPFSDAHVRHVITRGAGQEVPASITPVARAGLRCRLPQPGVGVDRSRRCRDHPDLGRRSGP